jgi:hypothetical protein
VGSHSPADPVTLFLQVVQREQSADALDGDDERAVGCGNRDIGPVGLQCEIRPDDELPLG